MKLIVGSRFQGKLAFAKSLTGLGDEYVVDGAVCSLEEIWNAPIVRNFHLFIKRMVEENLSVKEQIEHLFSYNREVVLICEEFVFMGDESQYELKFRQKVGESCQIIAEKSDEVYHMVCGIPAQIK